MTVKDAPVNLYYYISKIKVGMNSDDIKGENYKTIASDLEDEGFGNIRLRRENDLIRGWIKKEGTIDSITIDGKEEFSKSEVFYTDVPVIIDVHTFKDKGCDDITQEAN